MPPLAGKLSDRTLAQVLSDVLRIGRSGALKISKGSMIRQLFIERGRIIRYAASNLMAESLSEHLRQQGRFHAEQMRQATTSKRSNELLSSALLRLGFLDPEIHKDLVRAMIEKVVLGAAQWQGAAFEYREGELPFACLDDAGLPVPIAVLSLARHAADLALLRDALGDGGLRVRMKPAAALPLEQVPLDPAEGFLVSRADGSLTVREILLMSPLPQEETERALCGLILSGVLMVDGAQSEEAVSPATRPVPADSDAGSARRPTPRATPSKPSGAVEEALQRYAALAGQNFYQVLGVVPGASESEIRHAYYSLAKRLHPDKFSDEETKTRVEKLFAAITEAYATLSKPESRKDFDQTLQQVAAKASPEISPAALARQNFLAGKAHLEKHEMAKALSFFEHAAQQDPGREEYFRYLAMVQSTNPRLRREAEQNFLKAIELNPTSAESYALLGLLYRRIGRLDLGDEYLQRALSWDPTNETALEALRDPDPKKGILKGIFGH